jgi:hypothetical protein
MGASSSILLNIENFIYISYNIKEPKHTDFCKKLCNYITCNSSFQVITSKNIEESSETDYIHFSSQLSGIINKVPFIIICISPNFFQSFHQTKELNHLIDRSFNVLYIMMETSFTPITNKELNSFIKKNNWVTLENITFQDINNIDIENWILSYLSCN